MPSSFLSVVVKKDWKETLKYLNGISKKLSFESIMSKYGELGVESLRNATPIDTGKTSESWYYIINKKSKDSIELSFYNSNVVDGQNIAILIQYGHGTKNGGYVVGRDYINPALKPIFDDMAKSAWEEIKKNE